MCTFHCIIRVYACVCVCVKRRTHLGALDVIVQVITEGVDEIDGVVSGVGVGMTREQDYRK